MKLIKPSFEIITPIKGEEILKQIELAARTCYKSEDKIEYEDMIDHHNNEVQYSDYYAKSARVLIPKLIARGHEAMLEFGGVITVKFICDRGVSHELVRHRVASFAQESTRYCNYGKDDHITFIIPSWCNIPENVYTIEWENKIGTTKDPTMYDTGDNRWFWSVALTERDYNKLLKENNWSPQQARSVLPNSLKTEINVSANIRSWLHILDLRCDLSAHPQMRELTLPLLSEFHQKIPIIFDKLYDKYEKFIMK